MDIGVCKRMKTRCMWFRSVFCLSVWVRSLHFRVNQTCADILQELKDVKCILLVVCMFEEYLLHFCLWQWIWSQESSLGSHVTFPGTRVSTEKARPELQRLFPHAVCIRITRRKEWRRLRPPQRTERRIMKHGEYRQLGEQINIVRGIKKSQYVAR